LGVSKEQLVMFMNQPIIDEYLTMLDNKGAKTLFNTTNISSIKMKFPSKIAEKKETLGFNKEELEANIKNYYTTKDLGDVKNREQLAILNEFLKYAKMAEYNFSFTQATNYDTTKFQSGDSLQLKQWRTIAAQNKNIISSVGELLENNFIGVEVEYLDSSMDAMGEALVLETLQFTDVTNDVLKAYEQDKFLSKDKFDRIANKIKASFLDYIIQKRSDIATNLQQQLTDDKDSVAQMLVKAKKEYPGVQILEDLEVDNSGRIGGAQTIKLKVNDKLVHKSAIKGIAEAEIQDPVYIVGNPLSVKFTYTEGVVANFEGIDILIQAPCIYGNSGSAVVNANGELVGLVYALEIYPGFMGIPTARITHTLAVDIRTIKGFLENLGLYNE
jgi:hypothetical protein